MPLSENSLWLMGRYDLMENSSIQEFWKRRNGNLMEQWNMKKEFLNTLKTKLTKQKVKTLMWWSTGKRIN